MAGYLGASPVPQTIQKKQSFTATASQTTFTTTGYTDGAFINVYLNGVRLINGTDYTATNGSDIVLTTGASASDVLDFETFNEFTLVDQTLETPTFRTSATLKNDTHEDTDGGRESTLIFKGEQSGGEISTLAQIQASHDGTADDQKGDLIFKTNDGSDNNAPTERLRIDSDGLSTFTSDVKVGDDLLLNTDSAVLSIGADADLKITHDGTNGDFESAGDLTFDVAGDLKLDVDGGDIRLLDDGTQFGKFTNSSSDFVISSSVNDKDIKFAGADGGSDITALTLDMSDAGTAQFNHDVELVQGNYINFKHQAGGTLRANISADSNDRLMFGTGSSGTTRMQIDSGGNVMVGNTDVSNAGNQTISVGKIGQTVGGFQCWSTTTGQSHLQFGDHVGTHFKGYVAYNHNTDFMELGTNSTGRFRIAANGDLTATDTSISSISDERLKENIADYSYDINKFKQFTPKTFDWKNPDAHNGRTGNRGFIAQDVKEVDEYFVGETEVSERSSDRDVISDNMSLTSRLGELDAMYVSVIQQLITKIETLETKVKALEAE